MRADVVLKSKASFGGSLVGCRVAIEVPGAEVENNDGVRGPLDSETVIPVGYEVVGRYLFPELFRQQR